MNYSFYLFLHLSGVVLFLSGFLAGLLLITRANRTREQHLIAYSFSLIIFNDRWFMPLSILLILAGGFGAASKAGLPVLSTGWILGPLVLFGLSGVIFVLGPLPIQRRIVRIAQSGAFDWTDYARLSRRWIGWAILSFLIVMAAFALMVFKPEL